MQNSTIYHLFNQVKINKLYIKHVEMMSLGEKELYQIQTKHELTLITAILNRTGSELTLQWQKQLSYLIIYWINLHIFRNQNQSQKLGNYWYLNVFSMFTLVHELNQKCCETSIQHKDFPFFSHDIYTGQRWSQLKPFTRMRKVSKQPSKEKLTSNNQSTKVLKFPKIA